MYEVDPFRAGQEKKAEESALADVTPIQQRRNRMRAKYGMELSEEAANDDYEVLGPAKQWGKFILFLSFSIFVMMIVVAVAGAFLENGLNRAMYGSGPIYYSGSSERMVTKGKMIADTIESIIVIISTIALFVFFERKYLKTNK